MEEKLGPFTFISNFDSGNLARVERVKTEDASSSPEDCDGVVVINPDFDYNVWTAPDCAGTEFENLNRTWFYFGIKGGQPGKLLRINIMNLNRQGKLYGQGMTPLVKVVPSKNKWERIRDKPKYETVDGQFRLSFTYRFPDQRNGVHYFAFCYPYSYSDCQAKLDDLDRSFTICQQMTPSEPKDSIYFYRELLCFTLDSLRVDLLTITSAKGLMEEREESLPHLFPDKNVPRAHKFEGKKVFFLSARVHPGETPSSFVFNGFLDFILRQGDPRAAGLRDQYVFKLIPMLNPDGVKRGHYRTDQRGVNLNRVYMDPDPFLHPSIFAAKSIILYHHTKGNLHRDSDPQVPSVCDTEEATKITINLNSAVVETGTEFATNKDILHFQTSVPFELKPELPESESAKMELMSVANNVLIENDANNNRNRETLSSNFDSLTLEDKEMSPDVQTGDSNDGLQNETLVFNQLSNESTSSLSSECHSEKQLNTRTINQPQFKKVLNKKEPANCSSCSLQTSPEHNSGVSYYVDLHGHASKRGCFVYANYLENEDDYVSSILFPKLISLNSTNFDFAACNFTEKNMYSKDKRDGMSKEGSGRVAIFKATGMIHSYTLECNYNCGRTVNCLPPATCDNGCATPPPLPGFPPKYTPEIYEEVGRAMAVAVLDMNNTNPWTRLPLSEFTSLEGVKNWVRRFVKSSKNAPSVPKKLCRVITKTSSMVAGATASTRQKLSVLASSSSDMSSVNAAGGEHRATDHPPQNGTNVNKEAGKKSATDTVRRPYHLAGTRKTSLQGTGTQSGRNQDTCSSSPGTLSGATGRDHLPGPGPLRVPVLKAKEQLRVSLELPKTGPTLRLVHNLHHQPQVYVQPTSLPSKSPSSSVEIKMSTIDVHKQFIGFHRSIPGPALRNGHSSHSDEEKKKKNVRPRRKNAKKKEKNGEAVASDKIQLSKISLSSRPPGEEDVHFNTVEKEDDGMSKSTQLSRRNSSKNMISCSVMSCEVVDIKELPHTPQSSSSTNPVKFWPNTSVS
ncbi:cytosolic carboxypeptidase-like protein 5 isoform X1 [Stylophora pistillata]|uniref:Cytosolic carboxypeptidase-like protein 5 n=1 Tax=Stylophora pistillata TaxID=50429 RepID=A0A2B4SWK1_STYPI|nr:cytosolic carboxypeptidase-like protein 5 isoform X1 [Stylophora pistillata]PFX32918.1 Cytosolic carboxypeptidase-like protein 5 [Stylophora pistillata]